MHELSECKCVMCKHYRCDVLFEHKCEYFPDGTPEEIFNDNRDGKICTKDGKGFEIIDPQ